jgi:hypothetical protein
MRKKYISVRRGLTAATLCALLGLLAIPSLLSAAQQDEVFSATAMAKLPTGTQIKSFDISYVDPALGTYVLGDRTNKAVDVVDTKTLKATLLTGTVPFKGAATSCPDGNNNDCSGPDGVLIVPAKNSGSGFNEVWAGDGDSTVKVIPLDGPQAGTTTHTISTGGNFRADEMCLDTVDNLLMVANNADSPPFASIISTKTYTLGPQTKFTNSTNGAEQCQWSPRTGLFYITIPGTNNTNAGVVEVINTSGTIVTTFNIPLLDCSTPQGLAIGPGQQMMVGCNGNDSGNGLHSGIIINIDTGGVIAVIPNESGPDEVYFNAGDGQYFLARSGAFGSNQLLGVVDAAGLDADQSVVTANKTIAGRNAHSVAADAGTNKVFVPIPAGVSTVCGSVGGTDANGCIAVFTASPDDKVKPVIGRNE